MRGVGARVEEREVVERSSVGAGILVVAIVALRKANEKES